MDVTSDDEVLIKKSKRKQGKRVKKAKKCKEIQEKIETPVDVEITNQDKVNNDSDEDSNGTQKSEGSQAESEDDSQRRKSARNYWLNLQLEQNKIPSASKSAEDIEDFENENADNDESEPVDISNGEELDEESSEVKNIKRASSFAKNYWIRLEKPETNENQDDEEYLDAEENIDTLIDKEIEDGKDDNGSNSIDHDNDESHETGSQENLTPNYRMSASAKNFWLELERSDDDVQNVEEDEEEINKVVESDIFEFNNSDGVHEKSCGSEKPESDNDQNIIEEDLIIENENPIPEEEDHEINQTDQEMDDGDKISDEEEQVVVNENEITSDECRNEIDSSPITDNKNRDDNQDDDIANNLDKETQDNSNDLEDQTVVEPENAKDIYMRSDVSAKAGSENEELVEETVISREDIDENEEVVDDDANVVNNLIENGDKPLLRRFIEQDATHTDDELNGDDNFNSNYRYVVRHRRSDRFSLRSKKTEPKDPDTDESTNEQLSLRNPRRSAPEVNRESIENMYNFIFKDALTVLKDLTPSTRSSVEIDGLMSVPQKIYEEKSYDENPEAPENEDIREEKLIAPNQMINTRALPKEALTYELEKFEKNALIIFNQVKIEGYKKPRFGSGMDVEALTRTFENFGFEVTEHLDLTRDRIFEELNKFSQRNFTDYGCIAVAILTHGSDMGSLRAKDRRFYETDVINYFKKSVNLTLVTKPKLIIIQACRGKKNTHAVSVGRASSTVTKDYDNKFQPTTYTLPVESDFCVLHSTFAGKTSHRDEVHGSWLIQTLCQKINELSHKLDFESIITEVKREVAIEKSIEEYNRDTTEIDINKQMPVTVSTLIRKLYLRPFGSIKPAVYEALSDGLTIPSPIVRYAPCACFLDRFEYLRNCMRYFLEENEVDNTARDFLEVADALDDGVEFNDVKRKIANAMSNHLMEKAKDSDYFKYMYLRI